MVGGAKRRPGNGNAAAAGGLKLDLSDEQKSDIKEAFALFDASSSGAIDTKDLKVNSQS